MTAFVIPSTTSYPTQQPNPLRTGTFGTAVLVILATLDSANCSTEG